MSDRITVIDGHAHLDGLGDLDSALVEAKEEGVAAIIGVGMGMSPTGKFSPLPNRAPDLCFPQKKRSAPSAHSGCTW